MPGHPHRGVVQGKIYDMFGRKLDTADEVDIGQYIDIMGSINHERLREFREMLMRDLGTSLDAAGVRTIQRLNQILGNLPISAGQPPLAWAVVDAHLPTGASAPFWRMAAPATKNEGASAIAEEQNLVRYTYRSGPWDVNLYWPKGWNPPACNSLNLIPNGEFGNGLGGMKNVQPVNVQFSYTQYGGGSYTPPSAYSPGGPKKEPEKGSNYYAFLDESGKLEFLLDDDVIDYEEYEKRLQVLKEKYNQ
jgi:hypothetical protein